MPTPPPPQVRTTFTSWSALACCNLCCMLPDVLRVVGRTNCGVGYDLLVYKQVFDPEIGHSWVSDPNVPTAWGSQLGVVCGHPPGCVGDYLQVATPTCVPGGPVPITYRCDPGLLGTYCEQPQPGIPPGGCPQCNNADAFFCIDIYSVSPLRIINKKVVVGPRACPPDSSAEWHPCPGGYSGGGGGHTSMAAPPALREWSL